MSNTAPNQMKKRMTRKPGKTLLVKPVDNLSVEEESLTSLEGYKTHTKTTNTGSYFVSFEDAGKALNALKKLKKENEGVKVKFAHYRVFFTINGLTEESDYNEVKKSHCDLVKSKTNAEVLYYKLYRKDGYLGCGDLTIDTKEGLDVLLDKEQMKNWELDGGLSGTFYRFNSKKPSKSNENDEEVQPQMESSA